MLVCFIHCCLTCSSFAAIPPSNIITLLLKVAAMCWPICCCLSATCQLLFLREKLNDVKQSCTTEWEEAELGYRTDLENYISRSAHSIDVNKILVCDCKAKHQQHLKEMAQGMTRLAAKNKSKYTVLPQLYKAVRTTRTLQACSYYVTQ